jgi:hypothetical protein
MRGDTEKNQKNFSIEPISANPRIVNGEKRVII